MSIDVEAIRARAEAVAAAPSKDFIAALADSADDVPALLDEVERLRANECTRQHLRVEDVDRAEKAEAERDHLQAENEELRAQIAGIRGR